MKNAISRRQLLRVATAESFKKQPI
ncbi:hypothetical protein ACHAXS_006450 [Conticribra weissflogii]